MRNFIGVDEPSKLKRLKYETINALGRNKKKALLAGALAGAGLAAGNIHSKRKAEKVAEYYEEAQFMKQAAEEAYLEAQAIEDASILAYNSIN